MKEGDSMPVALPFVQEVAAVEYPEVDVTSEKEHHDYGEEGKGCGWLFFRPKFLQSKQTAKWVLFWLCFAAAIQGMVVNGFVSVCITTIERRYHLKSADMADAMVPPEGEVAFAQNRLTPPQINTSMAVATPWLTHPFAGLIAGAYDIGSVLCSVPISYLGSLPGASKPRWLGWGILLMGLGSYVFSLPHFFSPNYKDSTSETDGTVELLLCLTQANRTSPCVEKADAWLSSYRHVFGLGQFLHGVGASPLYTLGITFLDESVPVRSSSLYLGVFYAMAIVGPACGYLLGGQLLNLYIDSPSVNGAQLGLTHSSDQWLGAWWIGFLLSGTMAFMIAWAVMAFPPEIPGSKARASQRVSEANASVGMAVQSFNNIRDLPKASRLLASNWTFVLLSMAGATEGILLTGFNSFLPKFIESQFSVSASNAAYLVGMVAVPAGGGGTLIGGWIIKHFYLKCAAILKLCAFLSTLCFVACLSFVISCPDTRFAGVTVGYPDGVLSTPPNLTASCNADCGCENAPFDPVCGTDRILYFSPCHAGCSSILLEGERKIFTDCKCITMPSPMEDLSQDILGPMKNSSALLQKCPSSCSLMAVFLVIFFVIMTITFILSLPAVSGSLRCVPESHRSLALGLQWIIVRVLGTIPGPILFGAIMDSTCRLWQNTCSVDGACMNYDNLRMSRSLMAISLIFKCLSTLFFFLAWWFYVPPHPERPPDAVSLDGTVTSSDSTQVIETPTTAVDNLAFEQT